MEITNDVGRAAEIIASGRAVGFPTGTSYGLAVDALQGHALQRLRNLKGRPEEKTFTICLAEGLWDEHLELTGSERRVLASLVNQPLTLLVAPRASLSHVAVEGRVGLRVIDHPLMRELAEATGVPLTATSANKAGGSPCHNAPCVLTTFPGKIDETTYDLSLGCVLDGGILAQGRPSTLARLAESGDAVTIVREGKLARQAIERALLQS